MQQVYHHGITTIRRLFVHSLLAGTRAHTVLWLHSENGSCKHCPPCAYHRASAAKRKSHENTVANVDSGGDASTQMAAEWWLRDSLVSLGDHQSDSCPNNHQRENQAPLLCTSCTSLTKKRVLCYNSPATTVPVACRHTCCHTCMDTPTPTISVSWLTLRPNDFRHSFQREIGAVGVISRQQSLVWNDYAIVFL